MSKKCMLLLQWQNQQECFGAAISLWYKQTKICALIYRICLYLDIGRIVELDDAEGGTAKIQWPTGEVTSHNTGKDGIVEIKLVETHHVGHVYIDHLPVAGMIKLDKSSQARFQMHWDRIRRLLCWMPLSTIFQLYTWQSVLLVEETGVITRRKPLTCRKSLANLIT